MTEQELREIVREAVARHTAGPASAPSPARLAAAAFDRGHASHLLLPLASGGDGACLIEPAVRCTHCGYCQSYGH